MNDAMKPVNIIMGKKIRLENVYIHYCEPETVKQFSFVCMHVYVFVICIRCVFPVILGIITVSVWPRGCMYGGNTFNLIIIRATEM